MQRAATSPIPSRLACGPPSTTGRHPFTISGPYSHVRTPSAHKGFWARRAATRSDPATDLERVTEDRLQGSQGRAEVDATHLACSNYLRSIGIENRAELARILDIATNPNSLFHTYRDAKRDTNPLARKLDVDRDLKPLVEHLVSEGFSKDEVCKIVTEHPAVLCYSPRERLGPFFEYLRGLGIENPDRTVLQRPSLLGLTVDKNLRQMVEYLQQNEYTAAQIEHLLATTL